MPAKGQRKPIEQVLAEKIEYTDTCWLWTGSLGHNGYGIVAAWEGERQVSKRAHRFMYERVIGPIPDRLTLDHLCNVRRCVNPAHLEPVTIAENVRRGFADYVPMAVCKRGHLRIWQHRERRLICPTCRNEGSRRRRAAQASPKAGVSEEGTPVT